MSARLPRALVVLALSAGSLASPPSTPVAHAAPAIKGIDVSHWQWAHGDIDWAAVAGSGIDFAIAKATEGRSYVDPRFSDNAVGASANGIVVGMYHVASPALKDGVASLTDARAEADHFLDVASPGVSNLIPALDIEISHVPGAMGPAQLVAWSKAWVIRVTNRLGVHPMIYGSIYLFETLMGNSHWFANHGYPLWLARWGALPSTLPADDWGGHGWTFWQWSNDPKSAGLPNIPGIVDDVDRDRFAGTDLRAAQIARLTVETGEGGSVADATDRLDCSGGSSCRALFDPSAMVSLTATPDPGAVFLSWGGRCAAAGSSPTCIVTVLGSRKVTATFGYPVTVTRAGPGHGTVTSSPAGIACPSVCTEAFPTGATVTLTATPDAASEFDAWSGDCTGLDPSSCTVTLDQPRTVTATFADLGPPSVDITTPTSLGGHVGFAFSEPVHAIDPSDLILRAAGGAKVATTQVCRDADGERVSCATGPVRGATLRPSDPLIAGRSYVAEANPPGASSTIVDRAANALPPTAQSFDAATDVTETAPGIAFRWGTRADARASGHSYLFERRASASATFTVRGSTVTLWTVAGPAFGDTRIEIDGTFRTRLGGTRSSFAIVPRTFAGLGRGLHTLTAITLPGAPGDPTGTGIDTITDASGTRTSPATTAAGWGSVTAAQADGGAYVVSGIEGARSTIRFDGTSISLRTITGPAFGKAQLWIDGVLKKNLDLSAASTTYGVLRTVGGLADRVHTVRLVVVGVHGKLGSGPNVAIDGWLVG
jgi:GH25 family lysozyme M1 (1,4-beta-N-acetylmuramidase)